MQKQGEKEPTKQILGTTTHINLFMSSGKVVKIIHKKQELMERRRKYKKDKSGRTISEDKIDQGENKIEDVKTNNQFTALEKEKEMDTNDNLNIYYGQWWDQLGKAKKNNIQKGDNKRLGYKVLNQTRPIDPKQSEGC